MKLYSVQVLSGTPTVVEATVERETKVFYFVDKASLNNWSKRVVKTEVDLAPGSYKALVCSTPIKAWEVFMETERRKQAQARERERVATLNLQAGQLALDFLRAQAINERRDDRYRHDHPRHQELMLPCWPDCQKPLCDLVEGTHA